MHIDLNHQQIFTLLGFVVAIGLVPAIVVVLIHGVATDIGFLRTDEMGSSRDGNLPG